MSIHTSIHIRYTCPALVYTHVYAHLHKCFYTHVHAHACTHVCPHIPYIGLPRCLSYLSIHHSTHGRQHLYTQVCAHVHRDVYADVSLQYAATGETFASSRVCVVVALVAMHNSMQRYATSLRKCLCTCLFTCLCTWPIHVRRILQHTFSTNIHMSNGISIAVAHRQCMSYRCLTHSPPLCPMYR